MCQARGWLWIPVSPNCKCSKSCFGVVCMCVRRRSELVSGRGWGVVNTGRSYESGAILFRRENKKTLTSRATPCTIRATLCCGAGGRPVFILRRVDPSAAGKKGECCSQATEDMLSAFSEGLRLDVWRIIYVPPWN